MSASSASVSFPQHGITEGIVSSMRIVQEEYRHDIAVIHVPMSSPTRRYYQPDSPVSIAWARGRDSAQFTGVVHHVERDPQRGSDNVWVWCRGSSEVFDNGLQKTWVSRSVPSVVGELARSYRFDADISPHGQTFSSLHANGGRTWDFMVSHAKEIGYSLYAKNSRLLLHPRTHMVDRYMAQAPVFRQGQQGDSGTLFNFAPVDGAVPAGQYRSAKNVHGLNVKSNVPFTVQGGVAPTRLGLTMALPRGLVHANSVVSTPDEGRWKLAADAENTRFNITATALTEGDPRVHQTWPVLLDGVDTPYIGLWFVKKVTHSFTHGLEYVMELELGRDGLFATVSVPDTRAKRVVATRNNPQGRPKSVYPPNVLVNGQWRAQWSSASRTFKGTKK